MNITPVFKGMHMRQYHEHFNFALHFFQQAASTSLNLSKSKALPPGQKEHWGQSYWHSLRNRSEHFWIADSIPRSRRRAGAHHLPLLRTSDTRCARHAYVTWTFCRASVTSPSSSPCDSCITHILPVGDDELRCIISAMAWFMWTGSIFRAPSSTLYLASRVGGLGW